MTDMPEKIKAWGYLTPFGEPVCKGRWAVERDGFVTEYTRSGIEWNEALEAAAKGAIQKANEVADDLPVDGITVFDTFSEALAERQRAFATGVRHGGMRAAAAIRAMKREQK